MADVKGLWKDPRSGIFYLRRKVPVPLRAAFACGELYKVSLRTTDRREADRAFAIANGEYERKAADFRAALANGSGGQLSLDEARQLVERHLMGRSATGFASGGTRAAFILRALDEQVAVAEGMVLPNAQSMSPHEWAAHQLEVLGDGEPSPEAVVRIEAELRLRNRPWGEAWFAFRRRVRRKRWRPLLDDAVASLARDLGFGNDASPGIVEPLAEALAQALQSPEIYRQLPSAPSSRRRTQSNRARPDMRLDELCRLWTTGRKPRPKSRSAAETAVAYFTSYIGDVGIGEITTDDCFAFRDAVAGLPASMPRAHRSLSFVDVHALYAGRPDIRRISPASVKKYLGAIQALLGFAFQERFIAANAGAGIKVEGYSKTSDRRPFTHEELARLFAAPLFTRPWSKVQSRSSVSDTTLRWMFLLGLFTGGRIEELGQVLLADIHEAGGVWYIDVDEYVALDDVETTKSVKTDASIRVLPIHPRLIALGFADHVRSLRAANGTRLFPDLKADKLEVKTKEASRRAGRLIDTVVADDPRLVFHSFRHTFKDLCRDADIPMDVHDQLTGHAPATAGGRYGIGRAIANLHAHLSRLDLTCIDWAAIGAGSRL